MVERLEVGKTYVSANGDMPTVLFIGKEKVFSVYEDGSEGGMNIAHAKERWSEIPKPKKRFWLWDVRTDEKSHIVKSAAYMDDEGRASNGCTIYNKDMLIKKHESEFIEVDA